MKGEILDIETVQEMAKNEKELERLRRDRNFFELEKKRLEKELDKIKIENEYLKKRDITLTALENSLPQRIKKYTRKEAPEIIIKELQFFDDMLKSEKEKLLIKEVEEDEIKEMEL